MREPVRVRLGGAIGALCALAALLLAPTLAGARDQTQRYGRSVHGRGLTVLTRGADPIGANGVTDVLAVGSIHGNERAGAAVVAHLHRARVPAGQRWWLVTSINPDGVRAGTRQNARGVDLNRNFPYRWRRSGQPWDTYFPGTRAASEPETHAVQALIQRIRPELSIWYHQHANIVVRPDTYRARRAAARYATAARMRMRPWAPLRGTAVGWQASIDPAGAAFVVELPAGSLRPIDVRRHARAVVGTASSVAARPAAG